MRDILKKVFSLFMFIGLGFALIACGSKTTQGDIQIDTNGNVRPNKDGQATIVKFWGYGDSQEVIVFRKIVEEFNKKYKGVIEVDYVQRPSSSYATSLLTTLSGTKGPDVFYAEDRVFKQYASLGYLYDISSFVDSSKVLDESKMFKNTMSRYRYNIETTTSNDDDPQLGVPKDLAPTAIFYNETQFKKAGVTIISMTEEEALSAGYTVRGYDPVNKVFNNKVAMNWDDCVQLSNLLMSTGASQFGFFTEWWFNYGWSVGGNCVEYVETDDAQYKGGRYIFTLADDSKNYIVKDEFDGTITINGNQYKAGELISYVDKTSLTDEQKANCNVLPSQREAFTEFVRLSQKKTTVVDNVSSYSSDYNFYGADSNGNIYGYGITPSPDSISSDGKNGYFTSGKLGMLVTTMSAVKQISANMSDEWNVCPMLVYKEYSEDGKKVLVHGVEAAHSGSVAICINAKTKVAQAAYLFAEYIASKEAQIIQSHEGFAIPYYYDAANSDDYLNTEYLKGKNAQVFIDACDYEIPGDWWILKDRKWISDWQADLNGDVRNGVKTLSQFYQSSSYLNTQSLLDEYTKK